MRWLIGLLVAACTVALGVEFFVDKDAHFGFEGIPGFHALFGFLAFTVAIYAGKLLRALFGRDEDYYDR